jgi:hypothetical protein
VHRGLPNAVIVTVFRAAVDGVHRRCGHRQLGERPHRGLITSRVYGLLGNIVQVLAVRLWEWATRIDVGSTIDSDKFAPASIVVTRRTLVVAVSIP